MSSASTTLSTAASAYPYIEQVASNLRASGAQCPRSVASRHERSRVEPAGLGIWLLAIALIGLDLVVWAIGGFRPFTETESLPIAASIVVVATYELTFATFSTVGWLIARRHPGNAVGWLCLTAGCMMAFQFASSEYVRSSVLAVGNALPPGAIAIAWLGGLMNLWLALIIPLLLLFPDGRLPSRRWRPVLWLAAASATLAGVAIAFNRVRWQRRQHVARGLCVAACGSSFLAELTA